MTSNPPIVNIAAYKFTQLGELVAMRLQLRELCQRLELKGTILLSPEGINMFIAGSRESIDELLVAVRQQSGLEDLEVKESFSESQPFKRMLVKLKREIIAFGVESVQPQRHTSPKISAKQLREWLDSGKPVRLLDTRNQYEVDLGTFEGAEHLAIRNFREFPEAVAKTYPPEAKAEPIVMFCTGGIRCEKAGPMMEQMGFQEVYQLDGGILKYFEECGGAHYSGDCFVFDGRVALDPQLKPTGAVTCFACQAVLDHEDIQSDKFRFGVSCPHCYRTEAEARVEALAVRQKRLDAVAQQQSGSQPYDNRRLIHVPRKLAGLSLIEFLSAFHPPTRREDWLEWIASGAITGPEGAVTADRIVRDGEQFVHVMHGFVEPPVAANIQLIFEDEALIVVNKPAPLPVHPSGRFNRNTLLSFLSEVYRPEKLRTAHRIDANTSGLVILCRKFSSARLVQPQFTRQEVDKRYLLRVHGQPDFDRIVCEAPISTTPSEVGARTIDDSGQPATTEFLVRARLADGTSLWEAKPRTGRTNQIRIHAWHLGHSIVGDPLYLPKGALGQQQTLAVDAAPMCLHAWRLAFRHPFSNETVHFEAPQPTWADE